MDHQEEWECPYLEKEESVKPEQISKRSNAAMEGNFDARPTKKTNIEVPSGSGDKEVATSLPEQPTGKASPVGWIQIGKRYGDGTFLVRLAPGLKYEIEACHPHVTVGPNVNLREGDYFELTNLSCRFGRKWYAAWTVKGICDENQNLVMDPLGFPCHVTVSYGKYLSEQQLARLC